MSMDSADLAADGCFEIRVQDGFLSGPGKELAPGVDDTGIACKLEGFLQSVPGAALLRLRNSVF